MGAPSWWNASMPELVSRRELMQNVEKWQTMYVRYKCQPEAQVTQSGWDLAISQRYADQLALEEQQPYLSEESLLYNGLAPTSIALRIVEAPAEFAVPVKQDRRLTPNFKVRVEVAFKSRCSFPLTLKAYVITQQEKDSVPEWVPDDFLDPDLPQRKPVTELKGTTVITHHFEGTASGSPKQGGSSSQKHSQSQLGGMLGGLDAATAQALLGKSDPGLLASLGWSGDLDPRIVEQVLQESTRSGSVDPATAAAIAAHLGGSSSAALDALSSALSGGAAAAGGADGYISHDYEFSSLELVKPTRMNKVYLVFACSILEQDLMFIVYNIPTVGICRAEQRAKACQKLGISYTDLGGVELFQQDNPLGLGQPIRAVNGSAAAIAAMQQQQQAAAAAAVAAAAQHQQRKRGNSTQQGWDGSMMGADGLGGSHHRPDGLMGLSDSEMNLAALAGDVSIGMNMGLGAMQVDGMLPGLGNEAGMGMMGALGAVMGSAAAAAGAAGMHRLAGPAGAAAGVTAEGRTRMALRELLVEEYESTGLHRKLSPLDVQALESQAGFPLDSSTNTVSISQQQWDEFVGQYRSILKLLRQISHVWNLEDPCVIAGFDMDRLGTVQALSLEPAGTFICRFSMSQPGCLVLSCRVAPGHPNADGDGLLHAIIKTDDLFERRVETWVRDFPGATHILDVYKNKRVDKRKVFTSNYTRLRAMDMLDAYDDIYI